jgi:hypothetical protein
MMITPAIRLYFIVAAISIIIFSALFFLALLGLSFYNVPDGNNLTNYKMVYRIEEISENVRTILLNNFRNEKIANPNEKFNSTDVIVDDAPQRRLVFTGDWRDCWFVCYEHGGRGYHCHLIMFSVENKKVQVKSNGVYFYKPENLNQLNEWIKEGKFQSGEDW